MDAEENLVPCFGYQGWVGNSSQAITYGLGDAQGYVEEFESGNRYCVAVAFFTTVSLTKLEFAT